MKILLVIDDYATSNNGTSVSCQRFAKELRRLGNEVRVLSYMSHHESYTYALPELHIYGLDNLIHSYGFHFGFPKKRIMERAFKWADVVHFMMPFPLAYFGKPLCDKIGKPSTAAFHIQPENLWEGVGLGGRQGLVDWMYKFWWKTIYSKFHYIHCPSRFMAQEMIRHGYVGDIRPISNGISRDFVYTRHARWKEFDGKILITMVGRLAREKRQDLIIEAAAKSKYADKIQLIFAGQGPLQEEYEKLGEKLKNPPIFGYYTKEELIDVLAQCDLYVHASDNESEAISCIEAFAVGLVPIISNSSNSATPQFALDNRSLFIQGDSDDLARKIDYWLDHPAEKEQMEHTYAESAKQYTLESSVKQCIQMFQEAIDSYSPKN